MKNHVHDNKNYYKIVRVVGGKYYSCTGNGDHQLEYKLNNWTYNIIGHIFIFDNLANAKRYYKGLNTFFYEYKILKVKTKIVFKITNDITNYYPIGTCLTNAVIPFEIVEVK